MVVQGNGTVIGQVLERLKSQGKHAYVRKKNGYFYDGSILLVDENHVQIADRDGPVLIALTEIEEVREPRVGGRAHDG